MLAQVPPDSLRHYELDDVVVTAQRTPSTIRTSASAVTRLDDESIAVMPTTSVSSMLEMIPGFNFLSLDGLGYDAQVTVRGFYGGGEAEYVTLLIDGRPANSIERGLIDWNLLAGRDIASIEAVRGSVSSLYGDVTVGGIINVRSRSSTNPVTLIQTSGGSYGTYEGGISHSGSVSGHRFSVFANGTSTDGFRDHAARQFVNLGGTGEVVNNGKTTLRLDTRHYWTDANTPGPVASDVNVADSIRTRSSALYRFDESEERRHEVGLSATHILNQLATLEGSLYGALRSVDERATLELFPGFGDTQARVADTRRGGLSLVYSRQLGNTIPISLTVGGDASLGSLQNEWYSFLTGSINQYADTSGVVRGDLQSSADISRRSGAAYVTAEASLTPAFTASAGLRFDAVDDSFEPATGGASGEGASETHTAWSPRVGLNARVLTSDRHIGNIYGSVSRTFKTATLDQLYDQRLIPFGEFAISLSNEELDPQRGTGAELGAYHTYVSGSGVEVSSSLAVYSIWMKDELDFDLTTFTYTNLGESLHQGIEAGVTAGAGGFRSFVNYTYQRVTLEFGPNDGNFVKAIPKTLAVLGAAYTHETGAGASARVRHSRDTYLDDENTISLPDYTVADVKAFFKKGPAKVEVTVGNVLDADYSTTGYLLSVEGLGSQLYMYPAAGRTIKIGLALRL